MLDPILLAVDLDNILQIVVFAIIVISSLAGQFFKGKAERNKVKRRNRQPIEDGDRPRLENEIEAMLRRAVGAEKVDQQPPQLEQEVEITRTRPRSQSAGSEPIVSAELVAEPVITAERTASQRESIAEHVSRHMGGPSQSLTDSARPLRSDISQIDEQLEDRIQKKFDHRLGKLQSTSRLPEMTQSSQQGREEVGMLASRVVEMLHSPEDVKAAILLNEILRRPEL
ncbi:MAG: hypothetical protein P8N76_22270 [Pirellulaceae bacterium]|nr:hypothetical protein [Pirellulaceae bacterium]